MNKRTQGLVLKAALLCSVSGAGYYVSAQSDALSSVAYARSVYKTAQSVSLRNGMSSSAKLVTKIPGGQAIDVMEVYNGGAWAKIRWDGHSGYLRTMYLKLSDAGGSTSGKSGQSVQADGYHMYSTAQVTLRKSASADSSRIDTVEKGSDLLIIDKKDSWYKVYFRGKYGWISSRYVRDYDQTGTTGSSSEQKKTSASAPKSNQKDGWHMVTTGSVNFRSGASASSKRLGTLPKGTDVLIIDEEGSWYKVYVNSRYGFVHKDYLSVYSGSESSSEKKSSSGTVSRKTSSKSDGWHMVTTGSVNFRSSASKNSRRLTTLAEGTDVLLLDKQGSWYKVSWNGRTGWLHSDYVADYSGSGSSSKGSASSEQNVSSQSDGYHMVSRRQTVLRKGPGTGYGVRTTVSEGTDFLIIDQDGSWFKVYYSGKYSWVKKADLKDYSSRSSANASEDRQSSGSVREESSRGIHTMTTKKRVKLLSGPNSSMSSLGVLPKGTEVTVLDDWGYFVKVTYQGKDGYIHMDDLKKDKGYTSPSSSSGSSKNSGVTSDSPTPSSSVRSDSLTIVTDSSYGDRSIPLKGKVKGTTVSRVEVYLNGTYLGKARINGSSYSYTIPSQVTLPGSNSIRVEASTGKGNLYQKKSVNVKKVPTILVDPGHGGVDPGAIGTHNGVQYQEKDYDILFANNLSKELQKLGFNVVMTRTGDRSVSNSERVAAATRNDADLMFAVHHNATYSASPSGALTVYPSMKNSPSTQASLSESQEISEMLGSAYTASGMKYRGAYADINISGHTLEIMRDAPMRTILTEIGFITNSRDIRSITSSSFQAKLPKEMAKQIYDFFYGN